MLLFTCFVLFLILLVVLLLTGRALRTCAAVNSASASMATAATVSEQEGAGEKPEEERPSGGGDQEGEWTVPKYNHPVYKKLSCLNGDMNALSLRKLKEKLDSLNLSAVYVRHVGLSTHVQNIILHIRGTSLCRLTYNAKMDGYNCNLLQCYTCALNLHKITNELHVLPYVYIHSKLSITDCLGTT